jgi:hypothetical protein
LVFFDSSGAKSAELQGLRLTKGGPEMNLPKTVDQLDAEIKALLAQREAALVASKEADLETVKRLCRQHG